MNAVLNTNRLNLTRARLEARRGELLHRLDSVSADRRRAAEPLSADAPDRSIHTGNDAVIDQIGHSAQTELVALDRALRRLNTGRYGFCEECERPIEAVRLALVPYATRCIQCSAGLRATS